MAANTGFEKIIRRQSRPNAEDANKVTKRERTVQRANERKGKTFGKYSREA